MITSFTRATPRERRQYLSQRWSELKQKREPWLTWWKDISDYISPFSGRFEVNNHGEDRSYRYIFNDEASSDLNILVSGLASGATSPVRPWFRLKANNDTVNFDYSVQTYLSQVQRLLLDIFQSSNTYNSLHQLYKELCLFGVGVDLIYDDFNNVICHHVLTAGEYCLATDQDGAVDTLYREFQLTTSQAVKMFGFDKLSRVIQDAYKEGRLDEWWTFIHAIEPRIDRDASSQLATEKPFASYYFEDGTDAQGILRESGFDYFPALCPRWEVLGTDPYGVSPSITALPDVKQLQNAVLRKEELIELYTHPPVQAPNQSRQQGISLSPDAVNYVASTGNDSMVKPIIGNMGDLNALLQNIAGLQEAIKTKYFVQLFLMLQQFGDNRKTATEVNGLKEEKMLVLGPVIERLNHELAGKLIQITYTKCFENGILPELPEALASTPMDIEYTSVLAQAQRSVDINANDRMLSTLQAVSASKPEALDRLSADGIVDVYADRLSIDPRMLISREEANAIRQQRAQAQQQAAEAEQAMQLGQAQNSFAQAQKAGADASLATQELEQVAGGGIF